MGNLESLDKINFDKFDSLHMIEHLANFPKLCNDALNVSQNFIVPSYFVKAKKIVIAGMGGSGAAGDVCKTLISSNSGVVVLSIHDYLLPGFVDRDTLVIAVSYSGNTEETLSSFISAYEAGAKLAVITTGGKLKVLAQKYKAPVYEISYNCQPRASFPIVFIYLAKVLEKLGLINSSISDNSFALLEKTKDKYMPESSLLGNPAKILAEKFYGKIPFILASNKLSGIALRFKNQINENSKNLACFEEMPEFNHNLTEGIVNPKEHAFFLTLESQFEFERNFLRFNIWEDILSRARIPHERVKFLEATDRFSEILLSAMFSDFVSYYLAVLNKVDPGTNKTVDYLKERLV